MTKMIAAFPLVLGLCLMLSPASAQVTVELTLEQEQYLPAESLPVTVRITNRTGQSLRLGQAEDWLTFSVEARDNQIVPKIRDVPVVGEFVLESSQVVTLRVDVSPYFLLTRPGRYLITATMPLKEWNQDVRSEPKSFDIIPGVKLWEQEIGVLQRIALCYLCTSLLFCAFRLKGLIVACASLLLVYWALTSFVPIRDFNLETGHLKALQLEPASPETRARFLATTNYVRGRFEDGLNLSQQIDFLYLPGRKWDDSYDPEGILTTLPALATCLLGVFAGLLLKSTSTSDQKKVLCLLAAGIGSIAAGFLWGLQFPVIKKIWTSSYVLVAGGYSCLFLAAFYQMVEIWQWRKWCIPFLWIGMNPITIYLASNLLPIEDLAGLVVGGPVKAALGPWGGFVVALTGMAMLLALVRFLYQRKIFLRL